MTKCTNLIFKYFLKGDYHYWASVESDIFPPLNFIEHLMAQNKASCGLSYMHAGSHKLAHTISHYVTGTGHGVDKKARETFYDVTGDFIPVYQCGIGCLLTMRKVIKEIGQLRFYDTAIKEFPDAFFLDQLYLKFNYKPKIDTRHYCYHYNNDIAWDSIKNK